MQWIALQWPPEAPPALCPAAEAAPAAPGQGQPGTPAEALGWWALQFTPRVARVDEALLLEVSGTLRLWGGLPALMHRIEAQNPAPPLIWQAPAAMKIEVTMDFEQRFMVSVQRLLKECGAKA